LASTAHANEERSYNAQRSSVGAIRSVEFPGSASLGKGSEEGVGVANPSRGHGNRVGQWSGAAR
jgi:hypothetical protein